MGIRTKYMVKVYVAGLYLEHKSSDANAIIKSEAEWQAQLTPEQFHVTRQHGTERAGTSPLDHNYKRGSYLCAGCALLPGLVDCHTHLPFAGWRAEEYELKVTGVPYEEISRSGGGIAASGATVGPFVTYAGAERSKLIVDGRPANAEDLLVHYALGLPYAGQHGVLLLTAGTYGNVLRFLQSLAVSDELIADAISVLDDAFAAL